jgi:hypothetical protein
MWKLCICVVAATGICALAASGPAFSSPGGDKNAGDVWVDNVGQPPGPGHEMDPHLACQDINLWGNGLADSSGTYTIAGWPPSGHQETDYSSSWSYDTAKGGDQVTSVISVATLMASAQMNGDTPNNGQGYHFKLQFSQDPQKHKTFWVNCTPPPAPSGTTTTQSCPSSQGASNAHHGKGHAFGKSKNRGKHKGLSKHKGKSSTHSNSSHNCNSGGSNTQNTASGTTSPTNSVSGTSTTQTTVHKHKRKHRRHHRKHGLRHRTPSHRAVRPVGFTG